MFFIVLSSHPFGFSRSVGVVLPLLLSRIFRLLLLRFQWLSDVLCRLIGLSLGIYAYLCFVCFGRLCLVFQRIWVFKAEIIASRFFVQCNIPLIWVSLSFFEIRNIKGLALGELFVLFIRERFTTVLFRVIFLYLFGGFITEKELCIFFIGIELNMGIFVRTVLKVQSL